MYIYIYTFVCRSMVLVRRLRGCRPRPPLLVAYHAVKSPTSLKHADPGGSVVAPR